MIKTKYSLLLIYLIFASCTKKANQPFDWVNPSDNLQMLGEGKLSRFSADIYNFAFTIEGDTIFFHTTDRGDGKAGVAISTRTKSGWTQPKPAPFETENYDEGHVSMSPDGKHLIFTSDRTDDLKGEPKPADEFFVVSQSSGWTNAKRLTSTPKMSEKRGTLASDGTFYYWAYQRGSGMYFFKSQIDNNLHMAEPQDADKMLFENYKGENNPFIHPNKNYMLFAVYGKDDGYGKEDIYISKRKDDSWTRPKNLGNLINTNGNDTSPFVSPDGKYLFFVSDRLTSKSDTLENRNIYVIKTSHIKVFNQT
ncbi:WD40-like Beta Propeller Repeat [Psychroflexus salarius]|uniref:WD40-like Beta Propeller Repeat n=1 Tax=Psychroflexus salarius TaxID=1155689 RepID=A0A1M4Y2J7_9FLAO|nr:PD40 domain-containing protein [Psychroflexus salarius]SHE99910.1 WD40-like Beta Propeller Repeat [Psychroflexus salarius]